MEAGFIISPLVLSVGSCLLDYAGEAPALNLISSNICQGFFKLTTQSYVMMTSCTPASVMAGRSSPPNRDPQMKLKEHHHLSLYVITPFPSALLHHVTDRPAGWTVAVTCLRQVITPSVLIHLQDPHLVTSGA